MQFPVPTLDPGGVTQGAVLSGPMALTLSHSAGPDDPQLRDLTIGGLLRQVADQVSPQALLAVVLSISAITLGKIALIKLGYSDGVF